VVHRLETKLAAASTDNDELIRQLAAAKIQILSTASVTSLKRSEAIERVNANLRKQLEEADTRAREVQSERTQMLQQIENNKSRTWEVVEENTRLLKQLEESNTQAKNAEEENARLLTAMEDLKKEREDMSSRNSGKEFLVCLSSFSYDDLSLGYAELQKSIEEKEKELQDAQVENLKTSEAMKT